MARPLGRYQYYPENLVSDPPKEPDTKPEADGDEDAEAQPSGAPARMPTHSGRSTAKKDE